MERSLTTGAELLQRSDDTLVALRRKQAQGPDPLLELDNLIEIVEGVAELAHENVHLTHVALAAREMIAAEFEDEAFVAREKLEAAVRAWEAWEDGRGAG